MAVFGSKASVALGFSTATGVIRSRGLMWAAAKTLATGPARSPFIMPDTTPAPVRERAVWRRSCILVYLSLVLFFPVLWVLELFSGGVGRAGIRKLGVCI